MSGVCGVIDIPILILGITADWEKLPVQNLPKEIASVSKEMISN